MIRAIYSTNPYKSNYINRNQQQKKNVTTFGMTKVDIFEALQDASNIKIVLDDAIIEKLAKDIDFLPSEKRTFTAIIKSYRDNYPVAEKLNALKAQYAQKISAKEFDDLFLSGEVNFDKFNVYKQSGSTQIDCHAKYGEDGRPQKWWVFLDKDRDKLSMDDIVQEVKNGMKKVISRALEDKIIVEIGKTVPKTAE